MANAPSVPINVLVVDDDPAAREAVSAAVAFLGYTCRSATDGLEAWDIHRHAPADVILCDWQMPRMDGIELLRRIRAEDAGSYTYFILMTSFSDKQHFVIGMEAGADDYQTKPVELDELGARLVSAARVVGLHRRLSEKNAMLRSDSQRSFRIARVDPLTQIGNRLAMDEQLRALWARAKRYDHRLALAIGDIDFFKQYNDRRGHLEGDAALQQVASAIRGQLREGDGLFRYGGEEFVVVLPEQTLSDAASAMNRVRLAIRDLGIGGVEGEPLTVSFGIALLDAERDSTADDCLRRADRALYVAKERGRNRVEVASDG